MVPMSIQVRHYWMYTQLEEKIGPLDGKKITILGDIHFFSRVARSNFWALSKMGAKGNFGRAFKP